jgi:hypothetical protein
MLKLAERRKAERRRKEGGEGYFGMSQWHVKNCDQIVKFNFSLKAVISK